MRNFIAAIALVSFGVLPVLRQKPTAITGTRASTGAASTQQSKKAEQVVPYPAQAELGDNAVKLIATMPDPKLTRLGMEFDRWIDSLQSAAAASGYDFERQWVPWTSTATVYKEPGWMLFRNRRDRHTLIIFLVGESPASGIEEGQLEKALAADPQTLKGVVGPSFSGGFRSLKQALKDRVKTTPIVTGSATSEEAAVTFCKGCLLSRTVDTDDAAKCAFREYLTTRGVRPRKVAELDETDTAYGNEKTPDLTLFPKVTHIKFPRDISALRGAYESSKLLQQSLDQGSQGLKSDPSVALSGEDLNGGPDSVPIQSPLGTAATEDLEMQELSRRLENGHFSMASLRATNPLDIVFLRQYIAARDPDLQFYLLEPDILFTHQPEVHAFRGTLAVSRYSLLANDDKQIFVFPSKAAEGVYWAARSLLGGNTDGQDTHLWLSIIGIDGYWPVARLSKDQDNCGTQPCPTASIDAGLSIRPTYSYVALWLGVASALFFVTAASVKGQLSLKNRAKHGPRKWYADFFFDPKAPLVYARRYHAYCLVLGLGAILILLSRPLAEAWNASVYLASLPALIGLWVCCPLRPSRRAIARPYLLANKTLSDLDRKVTRPLTILITLTIAAIIVFLGLRVWGLRPNDWSHFAAYRSLHLGNGVNPTLPFLLTGLSLVCCAWYHFQRFIFASERFVPLDLSEFGTLEGPYGRVRDILATYATRPALISSSFAGSLVLILTFFYRSALSIEGGDYDTGVIIMLTISAFFTMLSVCQFVQTWWNFSDFLNAVQELPVRKVFFDLSRELGSVALFSVAPRERSYLYLLRARDCLRKMPGLPPGMLSAVETTVSALLVRAGSDERETTTEAAAAQNSLLNAHRYLLRNVQHEVWCKGESELPELKETRELHVALAEEFIALRFLSFIRYATLQLRNLLTYFSVGFILQAMAVSSYPFFSRSLSKVFILVTFAILSGSAGFVLWGMARDTTLRSLAMDHKGSDHPIALQALQSASLPLLAFASTYFPDLGNMLFGWINTAVELGK